MTLGLKEIQSHLVREGLRRDDRVLITGFNPQPTARPCCKKSGTATPMRNGHELQF